MCIRLSSFVLIHLRSHQILETIHYKSRSVARSRYVMQLQRIVWMELRQRLIKLYRVLTMVTMSRILEILTVEEGTGRLSLNVGKELPLLAP